VAFFGCFGGGKSQRYRDGPSKRVEIDWELEDRKYRSKREKKYRETVMRLNTTHYIDRPFTV